MCNYSLSAVDVCPCSMFGGGAAPPTDVESTEVDISAFVASSETEISFIPMSSITAVVTAESLSAGIPGSASLVLVLSAVDVYPCLVAVPHRQLMWNLQRSTYQLLWHPLKLS